MNRDASFTNSVAECLNPLSAQQASWNSWHIKLQFSEATSELSNASFPPSPTASGVLEIQRCLFLFLLLEATSSSHLAPLQCGLVL